MVVCIPGRDPFVMTGDRMNKIGAVLVILFTVAAHANVQVSGIFSDHMVIQREAPVKVWGTAEAGENVQVKLGESSASASAAADGKWAVVLPAMPAGGPVELTITGKNTVAIKDILFGDVWLCAGQSNMGTGFARREPLDPGEMNLPQIRYAAYLGAAPDPVQDLPHIGWVVSDPKTVPTYPAFPWFFAQRIHQEIGVPIGIIKVNAGGARIEWFLNPAVVDPNKIFGDWKYQLDCYSNNLPKNTKMLEDWVQAAKDAKEKNLPVPLIPAVDVHPSFCPPNRFGPFCFFFGTISPLAKFPIKGVAWYQGESNVEDEGGYQFKLRSLINGWRKTWNNPALPFYFVQLPNVYGPGGLPDNPKFWPLAREAQAAVLSLPNTGMAVTIDVGDEDLHPRNKFDMARRLAAVALAKTYGKEIECAGPVYRKCEVKGAKMILYFDQIGKGLMAGKKEGLNPTVEEQDGKLMEFGIAGLDRKFYPGEAVIEGDTVMVSSEKVQAPAAVRYAFTWNPSKRNLYGRNGLPVAPFRTDNW
jgi:sialate O-acetylesterase